MDVPQSVAQFGHRGIARKDDDFIPAYVLNYIIGGGGFSSRLMEEVREKRGLAYSVHSNLFPFQHGAVFIGNVATKNEAVGQSLDVIESELRRLAEQGPTAEELASAKSYLTGAYALRFESSSSIANQLLWIQIEDLGIDYVNQPQRADRGGDARGHQPRGQAAVRGRPPDHHHRRQAGGGEIESRPGLACRCRNPSRLPGNDHRRPWPAASLARCQSRQARAAPCLLARGLCQIHVASAARAANGARTSPPRAMPCTSSLTARGHWCFSAPAARASAARLSPSSAAGAFPATTSTVARRARARASTTISMRARWSSASPASTSRPPASS